MVGEMCNQVFGGRNEHGFQHKQRQQTWWEQEAELWKDFTIENMGAETLDSLQWDLGISSSSWTEKWHHESSD